MAEKLPDKMTMREQHHLTFGRWSLVLYKRTFRMLSEVDESEVASILANTIKQLEALAYVKPEYEIVGGL